MLVRDLSYRTVEELNDTMPYYEYIKWIALYEVEGEEQKRAIQRAKDGKP